MDRSVPASITAAKKTNKQTKQESMNIPYGTESNINFHLCSQKNIRVTYLVIWFVFIPIRHHIFTLSCL